MLFRYLLKKVFNLRERKDTEMVKPFLDHLEDLRWTLLKMVSVLGLSMAFSFAFRFQLIHVMEQPYVAATGRAFSDLKVFSPIDSMRISMSLALYAGVVLSFPLLLYFLAQFVLPALNAQEKRYVLPVVMVGFALFLTGVLLCFYFILPATLRWLYFDSKNMGFEPDWRANDYFSFSTQFVLIFGLMFELPVVVMALVQIGILEASLLRRTRAYAVVILLVAAMIIAPAPDPVSMLIVAGPMLVLYEACIWLAWGMERRAKRLAAQATLKR